MKKAHQMFQALTTFLDDQASLFDAMDEWHEAAANSAYYQVDKAHGYAAFAFDDLSALLVFVTAKDGVSTEGISLALPVPFNEPFEVAVTVAPNAEPTGYMSECVPQFKHIWSGVPNEVKAEAVKHWEDRYAAREGGSNGLNS